MKGTVHLLIHVYYPNVCIYLQMCHACTLHLAECERKEKQIQDLVRLLFIKNVLVIYMNTYTAVKVII